jgi:ATP-dependent helicase/nuclease subunit B
MIGALVDLCRTHLFQEKWLLAPNRRVGYQWLDQATRTGQPLLNVRVKTLRGLALEIASPAMEKRGLTYLGGWRLEILVHRLFGELRNEEEGYLTRLHPSPGLIQSLTWALRDLRLAGLKASDLRGGDFEVRAKGREIKALLSGFEKALAKGKVIDGPGILQIAAQRLEEDLSAIPETGLVLKPEDMEFRPLEEALWQALPEENRKILPVDRPGTKPEGPLADAGLLRWLASPPDAPPPKGDGTAAMFRAVGEANEVREIFRRCMREEIPFDEVEILHTDSGTYVPLLFEIASRIEAGEDETPPVTFAEGIPTDYSRPGRALQAWLAWIREGYPQATLVRMILDGLLNVPGRKEKGLGFSRLGAIFRAVRIGTGRRRTLEGVGEALAALKRRGSDEGEERRFRIEGLECLRGMIEPLVAITPSGRMKPRGILNRAATFLKIHARTKSAFDAYSRRRLLDEIEEVTAVLEEEEPGALDVWDWLSRRPVETRVGGAGPRPGCLFVSPVRGGGHSGRKHTFILGLDERRFSGTGRQDPLLLDGERGKIGRDLPTASGRLARVIAEFEHLLARLKGHVTLSYTCRSLADDRDLFPSSLAVSAFRILSGNREGDQEAMLAALGAPVSFAPASPESCLDETEWWLTRLCGKQKVRNAEGVIAERFLHLGLGFEARDARASDRFTAWDGYVPEAGKDHDPTTPDGPVLSTTRLEMFGKCPMDYFFTRLLEIEPPEEYEEDPTIWLDAADKGALLHEVFRGFMAELAGRNRLPVFERDRGRLEEILGRVIEEWKADSPPPNRDVFRRDVQVLRQTARIFLQEEEDFCRQSRPLYFEVAAGLPGEGEGTDLDSPEPVEVRLPSRKTIRVAGRIDRVDEEIGGMGNRYTVWDYKTGSSRRYAGEDPFHEGRTLQGALYIPLAESLLREKADEKAKVTAFGYFFPNIREHGRRLPWPASVLRRGLHHVALLCRLMASGCYPFSPDWTDAEYSPCGPAFLDLAETAGESDGKLSNPENTMLDPFRELRGYGEEEDEEEE